MGATLNHSIYRLLSGLCTLVTAAVVTAAHEARAESLLVTLIGDSHTAGFVSGPEAPSYAEVLAQHGNGATVVNTALGGTALADWDPETPCRRPSACFGFQSLYASHVRPFFTFDLGLGETKVATILLGTNDALGFLLDVPTSPGDYQTHLENLTAALITDGVDKVILMTPPPLPSRGNFDSATHLRIFTYRTITRHVCNTAIGVSCGPDVYNLLDPELHFSGNAVHPNGLGHQLIADALGHTLFGVPEAPLLALLGPALLGLAAGPFRCRSRTIPGEAKHGPA